MTLKDINNVIDRYTYIIICQRIEYDNAKLHMKSNKLTYDEFKWLVEKSDRFSYMLVEFISASDNNLYIGIY